MAPREHLALNTGILPRRVARAVMVAVTVTAAVAAAVASPAHAITGATATNVAKQAPYVVSIQQEFGDGLEHHCSGVLIAPDVVLSAAHCVQYGEVAPEKYEVRIGLTSQRRKGGVLRHVIGAAYHQRYADTELVDGTWQILRPASSDDFSGDIAVLVLDKPVTTVKPATIPTRTANVAGETGSGVAVARTPETVAGATAYGWGITSPGSERTSDTLRSLKVKPATPAKHRNVDTERVIIVTAENRNVPRGLCYGDSGGALVDRVGIVIGVLSYNERPWCTSAKWSAYTRISAYLDWLPFAVQQVREDAAFHEQAGDSWIRALTPVIRVGDENTDGTTDGTTHGTDTTADKATDTTPGTTLPGTTGTNAG